jgi:4-amino-4-deoxy-L-arabinose transferase-like glycosyltransferase
MIYWIGFRLTNRRAAALAGFLWLVFPPAVVMATWITAENLFTVAFIASMAVLIAGVHRRAPWLVFAAGIVLGLATMFRGTCLFLPLFLFPFWLCADVPRRVQKALGLMAGLACVVLPWMMRNRIVLHDPIPVSTGFGSAFLQGSDADFFTIEGKTANYPAAFAQADEDGIHMPPEDARESVKDNYQLRVGLDQYRLRLKTRPASFVPLAVRKALRLWYGTESGRRKQELILAVMSLLVVPLGLCRVLSWRKAFRVETLLLGGTILYFILVHWVSLPEYRYVHPIMPILILGMADGIVRLTCGRRSVAP